MALILLQVLTGCLKIGKFVKICHTISPEKIVFIVFLITANHLYTYRVDGVPSLGWEDTTAFLSIPIILVVSQFVSQKLMQPKDMTPEQEAAQNNVVLKFLPLLIGWFSINVPAALGVYWITNNFITTALSVQIRTSLENNPPVMASSGAASTTVAPPTPTFTPAPLREKPSGFATAEPLEGEMNVITDAEIIEDENEDVGFEASSISNEPKVRFVKIVCLGI